MPRHRALQRDAQRAARAAAGLPEHRFRLVDIGKQAQAALVIGLAVQRGAHLPGGALQQPDIQPRLQLLDRVGDGGTRQLQVIGRGGEAAQLDNPGEQAHGIQAVHAYCL